MSDVLPDALRELLRCDVLGIANDVRVVLQRAVGPDVAILDISMSILNGVDAARELQKACPKTKIILLTRHDEGQFVTESLRAGVKGYVLKSQAATDLVHAIQQVCHGAIYLSPIISRTVVEAYLSKTELPADPLTSRERQVLQLVGEGKSTKDVATLLGNQREDGRVAPVTSNAETGHP